VTHREAAETVACDRAWVLHAAAPRYSMASIAREPPPFDEVATSDRPVSGTRPAWTPDMGTPDGRDDRPSACRGFVVMLAEALENEALRRSKVLAQLDIGRASSCRALAQRARCVATRFASWTESTPGYAERQSDLYEYCEVIRHARELGVGVGSSR
jgi:hypothetical protein